MVFHVVIFTLLYMEDCVSNQCQHKLMFDHYMFFQCTKQKDVTYFVEPNISNLTYINVLAHEIVIKKQHKKAEQKKSQKEKNTKTSQKKHKHCYTQTKKYKHKSPL